MSALFGEYKFPNIIHHYNIPPLIERVRHKTHCGTERNEKDAPTRRLVSGLSVGKGIKSGHACRDRCRMRSGVEGYGRDAIRLYLSGDSRVGFRPHALVCPAPAPSPGLVHTPQVHSED